MKVRQSLLSLLGATSVIFLAHLSGCVSDSDTTRAEYVQEIAQWRSDRLQRLKGPLSWLSLIGRYPLAPGVTSVGTRDTNDIRLPGEQTIDVGFVKLDSNVLSMIPAQGVEILNEDGTIFSGGPIDPEDPPLLHHDALYWTFLERAGMFYFRLWDTLSPARDHVKEIPAYPPDPNWIIDVTFSHADSGTMIVLDDVQGMKRENKVEGYISGSWKDQPFTLLALDDGVDELFIIIEDETTDIETYPGGRYLDIPRADSTGHTTIDFNKAYIPPCAFTEFATCLLPPNENRLPFAVTAGEKTVEH